MGEHVFKTLGAGILFRDYYTNKFQPLILIYRKDDNSIHHHYFFPLSYP